MLKGGTEGDEAGGDCLVIRSQGINFFYLGKNFKNLKKM